jgi:hypothetical protein
MIRCYVAVGFRERSSTMVAKSKDKKDDKKKRKVKTTKLTLNKETVKELTEGELDKVQGGVVRLITTGLANLPGRC